jgi:hypothetical protein
LGAIDGALEHALQMVRKTRNDFAHFTERVNLTDPGQRCRVIEIARGAEQNRWWDQLYEMFLAMHEDAVDDTRTRFCTAFSVMLITLEAAEFVNEPVRIKQPANFAWG